ncbi:thioredoxin domain-containing protein [Synechococcus sp. UW105]|jgi:thiol:disulfide interchange protein|uniref:thioredoxin domain-containing protein n=1 Tax=Synechococcus sp. UW105 TaxID=337067 RepID=UPI000C8B68BD|nr:thioredoxin domain-containing protein [Synechococcus sp. UW105]MAS27051.1 thioredoxin [Synechococcus sp. NAT40]RZO15312.1 MAG: thioredoxin [Synechococcus sp. MED-G135]
MTGQSASASLSALQKILLVISAVVLAVVLFLLRNGMSAESPMDQLARRSLSPEVALSNQAPTMLEFYADWCEACREMAPAMLDTERRTSGRMDVVLINIDNPQWQDLIDRYEVNGIPQLNLFDADGELRGRSLGVRTPAELEALSTALIEATPLPQFSGIGSISALEPVDSIATATSGSAGPRSHG